MKVILLKDVKNMGQKGDTINVSGGYALNSLFPQGIAEEYTDLKAKKIEKERKELDKKHQEKSHIKHTIEIEVKANESGKLFEKITSKKIADVLEVEEKQIKLEEVIQKHGTYEVEFDNKGDIEMVKVIVK